MDSMRPALLNIQRMSSYGAGNFSKQTPKRYSVHVTTLLTLLSRLHSWSHDINRRKRQITYIIGYKRQRERPALLETASFKSTTLKPRADEHTLNTSD